MRTCQSDAHSLVNAVMSQVNRLPIVLMDVVSTFWVWPLTLVCLHRMYFLLWLLLVLWVNSFRALIKDLFYVLKKFGFYWAISLKCIFKFSKNSAFSQFWRVAWLLHSSIIEIIFNYHKTGVLNLWMVIGKVIVWFLKLKSLKYIQINKI